MHKYCFIKNTASNDTHIWGLTLAWSGCWRSNSVLQSNKKTEIQAMPKQLSTFREWGLGAGVGRRWRRGRRDPRVSLDQPKWDDHSPWANLTHFERHCQGCFPRRRPTAADHHPGQGCQPPIAPQILTQCRLRPEVTQNPGFTDIPAPMRTGSGLRPDRSFRKFSL